MITKEDAIIIGNESDLNYLIDRYHNGPVFAKAFVFEDEALYVNFFKEVGISLELFESKYYYFDKEKNVHISESEFGFVWISTMGLVATSRVTKNNYVNAFLAQVPILVQLLDEGIEVCNDDTVYDIDSYSYGRVEQLTLSLFHNLIFFSETLLKAYISLQGEKVPHTHKLQTLLKSAKEIMFRKKHDNTVFHAYIIPFVEREVLHISSIPGGFKEEYVKYDDNPHDTTLMVFRSDSFIETRDFVVLSEDIITSLYYDPDERMYLKQGLYERLLEKCETNEARAAIEGVYSFLVKRQKGEQEKATEEV